MNFCSQNRSSTLPFPSNRVVKKYKIFRKHMKRTASTCVSVSRRTIILADQKVASPRYLDARFMHTREVFRNSSHIVHKTFVKIAAWGRLFDLIVHTEGINTEATIFPPCKQRVHIYPSGGKEAWFNWYRVGKNHGFFEKNQKPCFFS